MSLRDGFPFWFPVRKFDDRVGLHENFRYLEDFLKNLSTENLIYASATVAASDSVNKNATYVCNGTNDTAVIQEAIDFVESLGGGYILFYDGTFVIDSLTVTESVLLRGFGVVVTTFQRKAGSSGTMITCTGDKGWTFEDILFDGQDIAGTNGLSQGNNGSLSLNNLVFLDFPQYCVDATVRDGDKLSVENCSFTNADATKGTAAIRVTRGGAAGGVAAAVVAHCFFKNYTDAIAFVNMEQGTVTGNIVLTTDVDFLVNVDAGSSGIGIYNNDMEGGSIVRGAGSYGEAHNNGASHGGATTAELGTLTDGSDADALHTHSADGIDTSAIHDDTGSEISAITEKGSPVGGDMILIEDSAAANAKKMVQITNLPGGTDADAIHDNVASEISAIADKASPVGADMLIIEDSEDTNAKKKVTITNLPTGSDADAIHDNVAGEIAAIAEKASPIGADMILIEDSAAADAKKMVQITNLPAGGDTGTDLTTKGDLHGYDTGQNRIPVGTNDHVLTADSAQALGVKWAAAAGGGAVPEWVSYLAERQTDETPHADDDFYDSDTTANYTTQTVSGTLPVAWNIGRGKLSVVVNGQTGGDLAAYLNTITSASAPMTFEARVDFIQSFRDFQVAGIALTDGTASSSNLVSAISFGADLGTSTASAVTSGTLTDGDDNLASMGVTGWGGHPLYMRVIWKSANLFQASMSRDGVSWYNQGISNVAKTMTPTHFGAVASTWGGSFDLNVSWDYFRVYDSDLSI